jgi:adhesin transport system membrane fusion protein
MKVSTIDRFPMLWLLALVVLLFVGFAAYFDIDQSVRAQGQVIPSSRTQVIQAVDGGVLTALHVREGDRVAAGQKIAELEPDRAEAGFAQSTAEIASAKIALIRAQAELSGRVPKYPAEFAKYTDFIDAQNGIYTQRKRSRDQEITVLEEAVKLAQDELSMHQRLLKSGDISRSEVMRAERQVLDLKARISGIENKYLQDARLEVAKLEDSLSTSRYRLDERRSMLKHTDLTSPVDGVVKLVRVNTVGGVLRPGDELIHISPIDDQLIVEVRINPADIGFLTLGLPVKLRFDAFDYSIFGSVGGTLHYISPDTLSEPGVDGKSSPYYRAHIVIRGMDPPDQKNSSGRISVKDIKPGLTVTADILTGRRSVLSYLLKPINRAFSGAMSER